MATFFAWHFIASRFSCGKKLTFLKGSNLDLNRGKMRTNGQMSKGRRDSNKWDSKKVGHAMKKALNEEALHYLFRDTSKRLIHLCSDMAWENAVFMKWRPHSLGSILCQKKAGKAGCFRELIQLLRLAKKKKKAFSFEFYCIMHNEWELAELEKTHLVVYHDHLISFTSKNIGDRNRLKKSIHKEMGTQLGRPLRLREKCIFSIERSTSWPWSNFRVCFLSSHVSVTESYWILLKMLADFYHKGCQKYYPIKITPKVLPF